MAKLDKDGNLIFSREDVEKLREALKPNPDHKALGFLVVWFVAIVIVTIYKLIGL